MLDRVLRNTAFGMYLGATLVIIYCWATDEAVTTKLVDNFSSVLTGLLSLIAAGLALIGVFYTVDNQREIEAQRRIRKLEAARALLPTALSRLCYLCRQGIINSHRFQQLENNLGREVFRDTSISQLSLTDEIIVIFKEIIELSEDPRVRKRASGILREYQVFFARWTSEFDEEEMLHIDGEERRRTASWAYLYAVVASMFEYARGETTSVETTVTAQEISSALNFAGLDDVHALDFSDAVGLYERTFARRFEVN